MSRRISSVVLLFALLVSCTPGAKLGGGPLPVTSPTPASTTPPPPPTQTTAPLTFSFVMPTAAAMKTRRPMVASANTESLAIFIYAAGSQPGTTPTATVNVGANATGCTTNNTAQQITCTVTVTAPLGNQELEIVAMSGPNGTGTVLSSVTQAVTVAAGSSPISVTLNGTPALIKLSLETPVLALGTSGTSVLDVDAYDASGALIVAPGSFSTPLTIASDSSAVSLSSTTASGPGTKITVTYGGSSSAPYAVHFTGTGGSIASSQVIGATLTIAPDQSMAIFNYSLGNAAVATLATTAVNAPPQAFTFLTNTLTSDYVQFGSFAVLPNGGYALAMVGSPACSIVIYPAGSSQGTSALAVTTSLSNTCPIVAEPNNDLLVWDSGGGGSELTEYTVSGTTLTATGRTLSLIGAQVPGSSFIPGIIAINPNGAIAMTGSHGGTTYVLTYAAGASGTAAPSATAALAAPAYGVAIGTSGAVDVVNVLSGSKGYKIIEYSAGLASSVAVTQNAPSSASFMIPQGLAMDSAGEALALYDELVNTTYTVAIDVWAPGANSAPLRTINVSNAAGPGEYTGPLIVPSPAPPTSNVAVTGDMFGYVASRTWTYLVTPGFGGSPYYVGLYADPNPVNGNVRFVGYQSSSASSLFTAGSKIGSMDLTRLNGSYLAAAFASVSSGTNGISGSVPGTPLLVPGSLAIGQSWNPLQNANIANVLGVTTSAQVVATGNVAGMSACPSGSGTSGATVQYTITPGGINATMSPSMISYVPGCGITSITEAGPTVNIVLQSVGSMPSLGQQEVPRGQPPIVAALHKLWQSTFNVHPPSN